MKKGGSAASFFLCCKNGTGRESDTQNQNDYLYADAPAPGSPNANNVNEYEQKYQYDKMGNVLQVKQLGTNAFTRNFTYNTDVNTLQKVETGGAALIENYTYDLCGNQINAGSTRHYQWTAANRLLIYKNQTGSSDPTIYAQYDYDAAGNRVSKLVRTGTAGSPIYYRTIYIDGIYEYHRLENGTIYKKSYAHIADGSSKVLSIRVGDVFPDDLSDATVYNLEDHLGGSTIRINSSGNIIDREEYYPFGDSSLRTFSKKQYRYVGKEKDAESGLYYYGARYYSAWTCRFISVDALAKKYNQLTPYQNAGNNPVGDKDIDGNKSEKTPEGGGSSSSASMRTLEQNGPSDAKIITLEVTGAEEIKYQLLQSGSGISRNNKEAKSVKKYGNKFDKMENVNPDLTCEELHDKMADENNKKKWMWIVDKSDSGTRGFYTPTGTENRYFHAGELHRRENPSLNVEDVPPTQNMVELNPTVFNDGMSLRGAWVFQLPPDSRGTANFSINSTSGSKNISIHQGNNPTETDITQTTSLTGPVAVGTDSNTNISADTDSVNGNFLFLILQRTSSGDSDTTNTGSNPIRNSFTRAPQPRNTVRPYSVFGGKDNPRPDKLNPETIKQLNARYLGVRH